MMAGRYLRFSLSTVLLGCALSFLLNAQSELVKVDRATEIPGATLKPGNYSFSVEDRMSDRAIVRVTDAQNSTNHYLLLAVPSKNLKADGSVVFFKSGEANGQALRAWKCSSCATPLEFVYPKLEAVKITDTTTEPVLAVDPTYDKLSENLSQDDMKVVTLWLLSPEHITASHTGEGVKAKKYGTGTDNQQMASNVRHRLPKTVSHLYDIELAGLICAMVAYGMRRKRLART
jgi:hypothetical protein